MIPYIKGKENEMNDQEMIAAIRMGQHEKPIRQLYKEFPKIKKLLASSGCNTVVAKEIFNDSLVLLMEKVNDPQFRLTSQLTTYLYGINRFLVKNELRRQSKQNLELEWSDTLILSESDLNYDFEKEEKLKVIESVLDRITDRCKQILALFYFQQKSMQEIADRLEFSSVNSAKTQKYKCIERASKLAQESFVSIHPENLQK